MAEAKEFIPGFAIETELGTAILRDPVELGWDFILKRVVAQEVELVAVEPKA